MKVQEKIEKYLENNSLDEKKQRREVKEINEKEKKTDVIKTAAARVADNVEAKLRGSVIKKPIITTLHEDFGVSKKEAERRANMVLSAFLKQDDEFSIEIIMQKMIRRYMRGL